MRIFFLVLALFCSRALMAEETAQADSDLTRYYDAELFRWSYSMLSGLTLHFQNQSALSNFGIKKPMKDALRQYEDSERKYNAYQRKTVSGNILKWGGMAATIAAIWVPVFGSREYENEDEVGYELDENMAKLSIGMMLGGLVSEIIGFFLLRSGQENIFNAVRLYNRHKISDYQ